jgi:7,8-dihydropterin-6-yl-methyl-4-(beta-D-ribofuranosyl)aminobenzene 5'-phosphate synthase
MAALALTTAAMCFDRFGLACATAGIRVLFRGRASFAVTGTARAVPVLFAACAGVQGEIISFVVWYWYRWFWHCVTIRTVTVRYYSYAHKSFKPSHHDMRRCNHPVLQYRFHTPPHEKKKLIPFPEIYSSMTPQLSLTVLVDNNTITDRYFTGEPGLSFLLETAGKKILFDTGYSGLFLANAEKMGIDPKELDYVVLSHGHLDHSGGMVTLVRHLTEAKIERMKHRVPELISHPRCFYPKEKLPLKNNGSILDEAEVRRQFPTNLSERPVWITDDLVFLGEIPRKFAFEQTDPGKRKIHLPDGRTEPDQMLDDSALAFRSGAGLVIITGCSHAGICNITEYAREVCGKNRVVDIIGGLHLLTPDHQRMNRTGEYLGNLSLKALHACHCTSLSSKIVLAHHCSLAEVGVGMKLEW